MIEQHPSQCGRQLLCNQSGRESKITIHMDNEAARMGSALHAAAEKFTMDLSYNTHFLSAFYDVDHHELEILVNIARKMWRERLSPFFKGNQVAEITLSAQLSDNVLLKGTLDLMEIRFNGTKANMADWKTDRIPGRRDYMTQMLCYALLLFLNYPELKTVTIALIYVREQFVPPLVTVQRDDPRLMRLGRGIIRSWSDEDPEYNPGDHCEFCPRKYDCEAQSQMLQSNVAMVQKATYYDLMNHPTKAAEIYLKLNELERRVSDAKKWISGYYGKKGETKLIGGGRMYGQQQNRKKTNVKRAMDTGVFVDFNLDSKDLFPGLSISNKALTDAVKAAARRDGRPIKDTLDKFWERMYEVGAVTDNPRTILKIEGLS